MAQQDIRYYLNGLLLSLSPGGLTVVATDGHRLALATLPLAAERKGHLVFAYFYPRRGLCLAEQLLEPLIIDLPQAVDAAGNNHAASMLERDLANLRTYFGRFAPELLATEYGKEIWALFQTGALHPGVHLTGRFERSEKAVDLESVVREIENARREDAVRLLRLQAVE